MTEPTEDPWRLRGVRVVRAGELDPHTAQTPGMDRRAAVTLARGVARMRWGNRLEYLAEAAAGDFIHVPPWVPHQELNASADLEQDCVLVRSGQDNVVVNLDLPGIVETPERVRWIDDLHRE